MQNALTRLNPQKEMKIKGEIELGKISKSPNALFTLRSRTLHKCNFMMIWSKTYSGSLGIIPKELINYIINNPLWLVAKKPP